MNKKEWKNIYVSTLMASGGLSETEAEENYEAGLDFFDFDEDPVDIALDELVLYASDG